MKCTRCGKKIGGIDNYGSSQEPMCYDCFAAIEEKKEREREQEEIKRFSAETVVKYFFKDKGNGKYVAVKQQILYAIIGFCGVIIIPIFFVYIFFVRDPIKFENSFDFFIIGLFLCFLIVFTLIVLCLCILFVIGGLFRVKSEIDFNKREVKITRINFRGKSRSYTFPMDNIRVIGRRMDSATTGDIHISKEWVVIVGIEPIQTAILSTPAYSEKECVKKMLGFYRFFFPDRNLSERNIITNNSVYAVLSDEEMSKFERGDLSLGENEEEGEEEGKKVESVDPSLRWDILYKNEKKRGLLGEIKEFLKKVWG
ncbi:MAG: hypothetical protein N2053_08360 [Chitinispirillaceae bacterium]|nr:hypothetical protein [Chitinispirillaceae bacterium]